MALVKMRKLTLLGFTDDRKKLLKALSRTRCTEIKEIERNELLSAIDSGNDKDIVAFKLAKYSSAITLFKDNKREVEKYKKALEKVKQYPILLLNENGEDFLREVLKKPLKIMPSADFYKLEEGDTKGVNVPDKVSKDLVVKEEDEDKSQSRTYSIPAMSLLHRHKIIKTFKFEKKPLIAPIKRITFDEFDGIINKEKELDEIISSITQKKIKIAELNGVKSKLNTLVENLLVYTGIDCAFDKFVDTKNVAVILGSIPNTKLDAMREIKDTRDGCEVMIFAKERFSAVSIICHKQNKEDILTALTAVDFTKCTFDYPVTAMEKVEEVRKEIFDIESEMIDLSFEIAENAVNLDDIKRIFDFYTLEMQKIYAQERCGATGKTFILEAWLPHDREEQVSEAIGTVDGTVAFEFSDANENEIVPSLTANNNFVAPYEAVTNMYSIPDPNEIDPNPFVAIFFFIFFGVMMADAGYGLLMTLIAFVLIKILKPRKGEAKLLFIILMGGISTIFWGVMFGGYFAIEASWIKPVLFNPLENPLPMLGLSLGLGVFQIMFGMGVQAVAYIKQGKFWDAVFDIFSWYCVFIGIGLMALKLVLKIDIMMTIGLAFIAVGVGLLILFGGRKKKGIGRVLGGFGKLYGIMNFLSDILSYSRLFGLGLASGVVGMVVNKIGLVLVDLVPYVGILFALPIFIIGHGFNIAINTLGAYVHNCRLQYIEFFSRFYTGSGHQFVPLATNIKYTKID